jgi:hypothetical protein
MIRTLFARLRRWLSTPYVRELEQRVRDLERQRDAIASKDAGRVAGISILPPSSIAFS